MRKHSQRTHKNKKRRLTKFWKGCPKLQKKISLVNFLKQLTSPHEKVKKRTTEILSDSSQFKKR